MQGESEVIDALNRTYVAWKKAEEEAHLEEHLLESRGYKGLSDWFDDIEDNGHSKCIHPLMDRINDLGGRVAPGFQSDAVVFEPEQIDRAAAAMLDRLNVIRASYNAACQAAERKDDYGTSKLIWHLIRWIERRIRKFERRIAKIEFQGVKMFLLENMD